MLSESERSIYAMAISKLPVVHKNQFNQFDVLVKNQSLGLHYRFTKSKSLKKRIWENVFLTNKIIPKMPHFGEC